MNSIHSATAPHHIWYKGNSNFDYAHITLTDAQGNQIFQCGINARMRNNRPITYPYRPGYLDRLGWNRLTEQPARVCLLCTATQ